MEKYYIRSNKYSTSERMTKRGKVYDIHFRIFTIDGECKPKIIRGFKTKTLAKEAYTEFVTKYCELVRYSPTMKKDEKKDVLLVGDLFREYLSTLLNQNKASVIYDKEKVFSKFILPKYDKKPLAQLTKEELYRWQDELWSTKNERTGDFFAYNYLDKIRGHLSSFLSWVEQRYGIKNNLVDVSKPKRRQPKKEMQFWTKEQFGRFIDVVDDPTYHALFTFMFFTGRRKGELFALYKSDVKSDRITFNKSVNRRKFGADKWEITSTKEDKDCTVPVCEPVREEIKRYTPPKEGKFYFGGENPLPPTTVERVFKKYTAKANLPQIRIHDLRHSFVSMLIHFGANFMVIADLISDTVDQVSKTYGHLYEEDKKNILDKIKF